MIKPFEILYSPLGHTATGQSSNLSPEAQKNSKFISIYLNFEAGYFSHTQMKKCVRY